MVFSASLRPQAVTAAYEPRGVGGGGAMAGYSISPYSQLRFVGTDMGTLFRSVDGGKSWLPVSHYQAQFDSNLENAAYVGFSADPNVVFFASAGINPKRSVNGGLTWSSISAMPLKPEERIRYWTSDSSDPNFTLVATTKGLLKSVDKGISWTRVSDFNEAAKGTFISYLRQGTSTRTTIYHATAKGIFISQDRAQTFSQWFAAPKGLAIRGFAGGADSSGVTMSIIDNDGMHACAWAEYAADSDEAAKVRTMADCGYVWTSHGQNSASNEFARTYKEAGNSIRMAENDSRTIYVTGGDWVRQYGNKVWVSRNSGQSWELKLQLYNWDTEPYAPWDAAKLEYSAVGVDVGWDDGAYTSFSVNQRDSSEAGGTGYYFLHTTRNYGENWKAPFTRFADTGERVKGKYWASTGLEITSVMKLKFHPANPKLGYASLSDMGGYVTEDGGLTWRIAKVRFNTNYDYAFDPSNQEIVYAASGNAHDFPLNGWGNLTDAVGGIFKSMDRGRTWQRLTPSEGVMNRQFLAVAFDPIHRVLYGGMQSNGIARSIDGGQNWELFNEGLPPGVGGKIIPQIEIDPVNGDAYALLTGDSPTNSNQAFTGIYYLDASKPNSSWVLLRKNVRPYPEMPSNYKLWWYPTAFAVDWSRPLRDVLWLVDVESQGEWLGSGVWKSVDGGRNWDRSTQFTHPTSIIVDPNRSDTVYAGGGWHSDGSWGLGGAMYTTDGGRNWRRNDNLPLVENLYGMRPDPNNRENIFYLYFGGGILYGPKPR